MEPRWASDVSEQELLVKEDERVVVSVEDTEDNIDVFIVSGSTDLPLS